MSYWALKANAVALLLALATLGSTDAAPEPGFRAEIEKDWQTQERRLNRQPHQPQSIQAALQRTEHLLENLRARFPSTDWSADMEALENLLRESKTLDSLNESNRSVLYLKTRWVSRKAALRNPLFAGQPLVFMKRQRFVCQMLHEYLGYYYDYADIAGGGVYVLEQPGRSFKTRDLIGDRLPRGNFTTLALSYDARTIYFAFAERAPAKTDFYSPERRCFHLYAVRDDGSALRPLTGGCEDDFDPCPLPDGGLAFISTRRGGFGRCHNPWEPLPTYTLHRMNADGDQIQTLSWHETNEWHPWVLHDGRILYVRWDYVDRSAANYHGLWISNPDGSNPISLFGNYTTRINACYQPRAIPGSHKILFVAGAHHADVGGSLVLVDPRRVSLEPDTGEDSLDSIERLTPEICFPEADGWPKSYFHSPWPLSEDHFLVAFSLDPLPGMSSGEKNDTRTGLYYFDRWGNLELLYRDPSASAMYPIPLAPRPTPPSLPSMLNSDLGDEGEFLVQDVRKSLLPLPAGRRIRELRVFQILPKTPPHVANQPRLGYANAESARLLLGTVPVEADGSVRFRAPARKPLYFQIVDDTGRAVQNMRSITYLQPGERRGCVGCHEPSGTTASLQTPIASTRPASRLAAGPDGSGPLSYPRLVQPVLDRHCIRCHDGSLDKDKSIPSLTGKPTQTFTQSYLSLKRFVRWHEWGDASISQTTTRPGHCGADESPLSQILDNPTHAALQLPDSDRRRLYLWLDANAPFYGAYSAPEQLAQQNGEAIPPPRVQ
ncbi:MAG TPA: hypothetical protein P5186_15140 [Candidatus Paceibacterota bacterium]|nr:hypothetical protein [Verrucomicrobiota bacterium]HRY49383.1 hypothetical protein [Candidatus Paceibacterota bacterium]